MGRGRRLTGLRGGADAWRRGMPPHSCAGLAPGRTRLHAPNCSSYNVGVVCGSDPQAGAQCPRPAETPCRRAQQARHGATLGAPRQDKGAGLAMQGLQLGKGMAQAIVRAILDIVPPMIPPPVSVSLGLETGLRYARLRWKQNAQAQAMCELFIWSSLG